MGARALLICGVTTSTLLSGSNYHLILAWRLGESHYIISLSIKCSFRVDQALVRVTKCVLIQ